MAAMAGSLPVQEMANGPFEAYEGWFDFLLTSACKTDKKQLGSDLKSTWLALVAGRGQNGGLFYSLSSALCFNFNAKVFFSFISVWLRFGLGTSQAKFYENEQLVGCTGKLSWMPWAVPTVVHVPLWALKEASMGDCLVLILLEARHPFLYIVTIAMAEKYGWQLAHAGDRESSI
eukprot:Gb_08325 [translate_table: standard]